MKKIKFILALLLALSALAITAQNFPMFVKPAGTMNRDADFSCVPNSLYSQLPSPITTGWFGDDAYFFFRVADDYTVASSFTTMRFWGTNYYGCPIGATQAFIIKFYQRNPSDPTIPGAEVNSFSLTAVPQPIYLLYNPDYQIDVTFPSAISQLDGWVSITRVNPGDGCTFIWYGRDSGNSASYSGDWTPSGGMLAFCLGGAVW